MGNSESSTSAPSPADAGTTMDDFDGIETLGYRVLGVQPNSPASSAGLVSFFDFLVGANGEMLLGSGEELQEGEEYDDIDFPALLEKFKGESLQLLVWNIKCQQQRLVDITPSDDWEGAGLLGVTIRLDNYAGAEDRLIRILSVEVNSPAAIAGLVSSQDYLLGTTTHSFDSTKVLSAVLEANVDKVVELYVYNTNSDKVRVVALMPTWSWGGNGLLGAEVGTGYLHRLPGSCRSTLGGSVERRVRWIGGSKTGPTSPSQLQQAATLELEPQLEMEPNHDDEEADEDEQERLQREESMGTVSLASQVETGVSGEPNKETSNGNSNNDNTSSEAKANTTPSNKSAEYATNDIKVFDPTTTKPPVTPVMTQSAFQQQHSPQAPTPSPYPLTSSSDPAAQPITMTTFIPAAKPPPTDASKPVSAEDLFSGPPPVAKIPTKTTLSISSSIGSAGSHDSLNSGNNNGQQYHTPTNQYRKSPPPANVHVTTTATATPDHQNKEDTFSTPHPPNSAVRPGYENTGGNPPVPPVASYDYGNSGSSSGMGASDFLPPPPKMSGAHQ